MRMDPNRPSGMQDGIEAMAADLETDCKHLATLRDLEICPEDLDSEGSASRQHFIDTGRYLSEHEDDATEEALAALEWLSQRISDIGEDAARDEIDGNRFQDNLGIKLIGSQWLGNSDGWELERVEIVLGTGGPHIEIVTDDEWSDLRGYWGGERGSYPLGPAASAEAQRMYTLADELQACH
jgi:hypothetical protein